MDKQRTVRRTVLAMALAALGTTGAALAGDFAQPQKLNVVSGTANVTATITNGTLPDVHYYALEVHANDSVTIDVDGTAGLDAVLHVFNPLGEMVFSSLETDPIDPGSNPSVDCPDCPASPDPMLQGIPLTAGTWIVAVSAEPAYLTDNGQWMFTPPDASTDGAYTLIVSGLSAAPAPTPTPVPTTPPQVQIDIKPRQAGPATIHANARGAIPVAILSDGNGFDPFAVDPASLRFGRTGNEFSYKFCAKEGWDLNRDGMRDRFCFFDAQRTGFKSGDTIGVLKGIKDGRWFEGKGDLKIVGEKRARYEKERNKKKHKRDRHGRDDRRDRDD